MDVVPCGLGPVLNREAMGRRNGMVGLSFFMGASDKKWFRVLDMDLMRIASVQPDDYTPRAVSV